LVFFQSFFWEFLRWLTKGSFLHFYLHFFFSIDIFLFFFFSFLSFSLSNAIRVGINGQLHTITEFYSKTTLAEYLRSQITSTGTKISCSEGGCGACTVVLSYIDPITKTEKHKSVNSCLYPLLSCDGQHITTVEGLGSSSKGWSFFSLFLFFFFWFDTELGFHPIQSRLSKLNGVQCGFCSPGFVMQMFNILKNNQEPTSMEINKGFDGNICRCTGYRPIIDAFTTFAKDKPNCIGCERSCHG